MDAVSILILLSVSGWAVAAYAWFIRKTDEITTLRQQLAESKEREATSFYQGVCTTLAMFDPHSTEYHESVLQHGGYHVLWEVASDYDKEHLLAAAKANYGGGYEAWLSQESGQPSKQEGSGDE